jgi:hypothetical protein
MTYRDRIFNRLANYAGKDRLDAAQIAAEADAEIEGLHELVLWAYTKLHSRTFSSMDDALKLDEMKLLLEHGL